MTTDPGNSLVTGTTPYPWPYDARFTAAGTATLVVVPADGGPPVPGTVAAGIRAVAAAVTAGGGIALLVTTGAPASGTEHLRDDGVAGVAPADVADVTAVVTSTGIDGFLDGTLETFLRRHGVERLLLTGVGLETCVHSTLRSANDRGYECLLVADLCVAHDPELLAPALSMIEMSGGIFGAVGHCADVLDALRKD
jgi:nicotinamidase-related amidase